MAQQTPPPPVAVGPQAAVDGVVFDYPQGAEPILRADFTLPRSEKIAGVEIIANGKPADKDKVKFLTADAVPGHKSAILLLVDNTVDMVKAESLERIKTHLQSFSSYAEMPAFAIGVATFAQDLNALVPVGGKRSEIVDAIKKIDGKGTTTEGYRSLLSAIEKLRSVSAARKYVVVMSNGRFEDTAYKHEDVVKAALEAKVVIYGVGFPPNPSAVADGQAQVQRLERLAKETRGLDWRANEISGEISPDFVSTLMASTISGGRVDFNVAGQTAPLTVEYRVTTDNKGTYSFSTRLENLPVATAPPVVPPVTPPAVNPVPNPNPNPGPTPNPTPNPNPAPDNNNTKTPDPKAADKKDPNGGSSNTTPSTLDQVIKRLKEHPVLASVAGVALLLGLVLLVMMLKRAFTNPPPPPPPVSDFGSPDFGSMFPPPIDDPAAFSQEVFSADDPLGTSVTMPSLVPPTPRQSALAWLEALDADKSRHDISKSAVRIGRKVDNDIVIRNDSVSGHHAEIIKRGDQFIITDLDSPNHVYINNKRVEKATIEHNDLIELGEVRFRFLRADRT